MAIAKGVDEVRPLASVATIVYPVVGRDGTAKVPLIAPAASVVRVSSGSVANLIATVVPAIAVKLLPVIAMVTPGAPEVGVTVIPVTPLTLKVAAPMFVPSVALITSVPVSALLLRMNDPEKVPPATVVIGATSFRG